MAQRSLQNSLAENDESTGVRRWIVALRLLVLIVGGYAAASALVAGAARGLASAGLARSEAVALASMCGFGFYLGLLIWGLSEQRLKRLVLGFTLVGGFGLALITITQA